MHFPENSISRRRFLQAGATAAGVAAFAPSVFADNKLTPHHDWPMANGPDGNFTPRKAGVKLIDDLSKAKTVWTSADHDLGYGKGSASGYIANLARWPGHPGSCSTPIIAGGSVFCSSFRPSGKVWAESLPHLKHEKNARWFKDPKTAAQLKANLRISADDLLVAIDAVTGKTRWKAVEEGKGVNLYMGKREGFAVAPAYHNGRVFSMGSTGRLYAYDAKSGRKLWEKNIGNSHDAIMAEKKRAITRKVLPKTFGWDVSLTVIGGVLIVPIFDSLVDTSLRGIDPATGKTLWERKAATSRYATPAMFREEDREYLLAATRKGKLRMIDPRSGKVLWTVSGLQPTYFALSPSADSVFVNVGSKSKLTGKRGRPFGLLGCYGISPSGAKLRWKMPDKQEFWFENHMDSCARRKVVLRDGLVYCFAANKAGGGRNRTLSILRENDGKILYQQKDLPGPPVIYPIEDRLLYIPDAWHSDRQTLQLYSADPKAFKQLGETWKPPHTATTGYEVAMEVPYVQGRIYMRSRSGDVRCYDLRRGR